MLTEKQLKQRKIFEISLSESPIYKKWQTSAIIREISDSNLEIRRNSLNLESPGLSGRVDSPARVPKNHLRYPVTSFGGLECSDLRPQTEKPGHPQIWKTQTQKTQTPQENLTRKLRQNLSVFILDPHLKPCLELGGKMFMDRSQNTYCTCM